MSNVVRIEQPVRSRSYHQWTVSEVKTLNEKPDDMCWKEWLDKHGINVSVCAAIARKGDIAKKVYKPKYDEELARQITKVVSEVFGSTVEMFQRKDKRQDVTYARYIAIKMLLTNVKKLSLLEAARLVGRNDHTTSIHALEEFNKLIKYPDFLAKYALVVKKLSID